MGLGHCSGLGQSLERGGFGFHGSKSRKNSGTLCKLEPKGSDRQMLSYSKWISSEERPFGPRSCRALGPRNEVVVRVLQILRALPVPIQW